MLKRINWNNSDWNVWVCDGCVGNSSNLLRGPPRLFEAIENFSWRYFKSWTVAYHAKNYKKRKVKHIIVETTMKITLTMLYWGVLFSIANGDTGRFSSGFYITIGIPVALSSIKTPIINLVLFALHWIDPDETLTVTTKTSIFQWVPLDHAQVPFSQSSPLIPVKVMFKSIYRSIGSRFLSRIVMLV